MSEGFFRVNDNPSIPASVVNSLSGVLRFSTGRQLHHRLFSSSDEASAWTGFVHEGGRDLFRSGWTQEELDQLDLTIGGSDWAKGFYHELVVHLASGGELPYVTEHAGYATACLISEQGYLLTNQHLVSAASWYQRMTQLDPNRADGQDQPEHDFSEEGQALPYAEIFTADGQSLGSVTLHYLNTSLDLAVLKLTQPSDLRPIPLRSEEVKRHERIWQWGYPPHTSRPDSFKEFLGYEDARGHLTYSPGLVVSDTSQAQWYTDADAAFGSSGSAVLDDLGRLVGVRCGGGARSLPKEDWFRYNRVTDVYSLRELLPAYIFS